MKINSNSDTETRTKNYLLVGDFCWCFTSEIARCYAWPHGLATLKKAIPAHDEELMRCTNEINAIVKNVVKNNSRKGVHLHLLDTPRGFLMAWAGEGVSGNDDDKTIDKAFGLKK
jgi:hypothetical protein